MPISEGVNCKEINKKISLLIGLLEEPVLQVSQLS